MLIYSKIHATTIDNDSIMSSLSQGETLGNRQDAVVRSLVSAKEQQLELAA